MKILDWIGLIWFDLVRKNLSFVDPKILAKFQPSQSDGQITFFVGFFFNFLRTTDTKFFWKVFLVLLVYQNVEKRHFKSFVNFDPLQYFCLQTTFVRKSKKVSLSSLDIHLFLNNSRERHKFYFHMSFWWNDPIYHY